METWGQNAWEEVNYEPFGQGGRNYGWRNREGAHDNVTTEQPAFLPLTDPIIEYSHDVGNVITGGVVYRGTALGPGFAGRYFYADFGAGRLSSAFLNVNPLTAEATAQDIVEHTAELEASAGVGNISGFGLDASSEMYLVDYGGRVLRVVAASAPPSDSCPSPDPFIVTWRRCLRERRLAAARPSACRGLGRIDATRRRNRRSSSLSVSQRHAGSGLALRQRRLAAAGSPRGGGWVRRIA